LNFLGPVSHEGYNSAVGEGHLILTRISRWEFCNIKLFHSNDSAVWVIIRNGVIAINHLFCEIRLNHSLRGTLSAVETCLLLRNRNAIWSRSINHYDGDILIVILNSKYINAWSFIDTLRIKRGQAALSAKSVDTDISWVEDQVWALFLSSFCYNKFTWSATARLLERTHTKRQQLVWVWVGAGPARKWLLRAGLWITRITTYRAWHRFSWLNMLVVRCIYAENVVWHNAWKAWKVLMILNRCFSSIISHFNSRQRRFRGSWCRRSWCL
jgi:hypothetical protein